MFQRGRYRGVYGSTVAGNVNHVLVPKTENVCYAIL